MLSEKGQELTDIELAILLCLVADEHCIIQSEGEGLHKLSDEVQLVCHTLSSILLSSKQDTQIATNIFGLSCAIVDCGSTMTVDEFSAGILVNGNSDQRNTNEEDERISGQDKVKFLQRDYSGHASLVSYNCKTNKIALRKQKRRFKTVPPDCQFDSVEMSSVCLYAMIVFN